MDGVLVIEDSTQQVRVQKTGDDYLLIDAPKTTTTKYVDATNDTLLLQTTGPQGLNGADGATGPAGPPGNGDDLPDMTLIFENGLS